MALPDAQPVGPHVPRLRLLAQLERDVRYYVNQRLLPSSLFPSRQARPACLRVPWQDVRRAQPCSGAPTSKAAAGPCPACMGECAAESYLGELSRRAGKGSARVPAVREGRGAAARGSYGRQPQALAAGAGGGPSQQRERARTTRGCAVVVLRRASERCSGPRELQRHGRGRQGRAEAGRRGGAAAHRGDRHAGGAHASAAGAFPLRARDAAACQPALLAARRAGPEARPRSAALGRAPVGPGAGWRAVTGRQARQLGPSWRRPCSIPARPGSAGSAVRAARWTHWGSASGWRSSAES